ncbi:Transmembrane protein of unknown function [Marinactinospora thermotolerans DSM 45154]|uniref:DUF3566 domain-containing protein n=1 Tax=Marinactinospora thermotolerans DSM 45154 TaxID=1122192 RepID=A0A1T4RET6_9ACTN|nr:DUF3566 domain-containing protein [Marinactinospora thermotolerans]SKA14181.1 Transmembrane protein of unknown function [Marinactinospora thermotolerans DSM 45154]
MSDNAQRQSAAQEPDQADNDSREEHEEQENAAPPAVTADGADSSTADSAEQGDVTMAVPETKDKSGAKPVNTARKAHLSLTRVEPGSVLKFSFVISLVCFIVLFVAVAVLYAFLSTLGVFDAVTDLINSLTDGGEGDELPLNPENWFSAARVLGYTGLLGALNIVLITALSTVGAMLYNLAADLVGGIDVTLSETE